MTEDQADDAAAEATIAAIQAGRLDRWLVRLSGAIKLRRQARNRER